MLPISYASHQFPSVIIRHGVWLYLRFTLGYRDVEDLLAGRGLDVSYEMIRRWVLKFGPDKAALLLMRKRLKKQGFAPALVVTDKLRSYAAAFAELGLTARDEQGLNNRAENSHQPLQRRERKMQRFLAVHSVVHNTFTVQRHLVSRRTLRHFRADAIQQWRVATMADLRISG